MCSPYSTATGTSYLLPINKKAGQPALRFQPAITLQFKTMKFLFVASLAFLVLGALHCSPPLVMTTWKDKLDSVPLYENILVVGVIRDTNLKLRKQMEQHIVSDLRALGYRAHSALEVFGAKGLAHMDQEETYRRLYSKGFDGLITIALLDKQKEAAYTPAIVKYYSNLYFYNRIWNYKYIQADLTKTESDLDADSKFRWECIFFDLQKLAPLFAVQTKPIDPTATETEAHTYGLMIVSEMRKHKLIKKRVEPQPLKTF